VVFNLVISLNLFLVTSSMILASIFRHCYLLMRKPRCLQRLQSWGISFNLARLIKAGCWRTFRLQLRRRAVDIQYVSLVAHACVENAIACVEILKYTVAAKAITIAASQNREGVKSFLPAGPPGSVEQPESFFPPCCTFLPQISLTHEFHHIFHFELNKALSPQHSSAQWQRLW